DLALRPLQRNQPEPSACTPAAVTGAITRDRDELVAAAPKQLAVDAAVIAKAVGATAPVPLKGARQIDVLRAAASSLSLAYAPARLVTATAHALPDGEAHGR